MRKQITNIIEIETAIVRARLAGPLTIFAVGCLASVRPKLD